MPAGSEEETGESVTTETGGDTTETEGTAMNTKEGKAAEPEQGKKKEDKKPAANQSGKEETKVSGEDTRYYDKTEEKTRSGGGSSKKETDKTAEQQKEVDEEVKGGRMRRMYFMRHAERMDRIFPGWTKLAFTDGTRYRPYDLNHPLSLPKREGGAAAYVDDSPITEMGYVTAQMVGRGMRVSRIFFKTIYTSPALRCIQTGHGLLKTLNMNVKMRVEPGLFEWMAWYQKPLKWLTKAELSKTRYEVDTEYKPIMTEEELMAKRAETGEEHYNRIEEVCQKILKKHPVGNILIIGHGTTVDAGSRSLLNRQATDFERKTLDKIGLYFPYCCVVGIEEADSGAEWKTIHNPLPPISYVDGSNRIDHQFFNRTP